MPITRRAFGPLLAAGAAALPRAGRAQTPATAPWPDRPVRAVVPFGPGGAIDILIRLLAPHFPALANGQSLVVENRPGAGGTIGTAQVAQARPDGATFLVAELASAALAHELYRDLPYDPRRSFTPVVFLAEMPMVLVVRASLPQRDLPALLAAARARPGGFSYGTVGAGHISHLTMEMLQRRAGGGMGMLHVVYRSGAEMVAAVAKGEVDATVTSFSSSAPFLAAGSVRLLAVTTPARLPDGPEVPTLSETGRG
jgi:tripartite-type tricarboxylate transporter receptor subunit TctC